LIGRDGPPRRPFGVREWGGIAAGLWPRQSDRVGAGNLLYFQLKCLLPTMEPRICEREYGRAAACGMPPEVDTRKHGAKRRPLQSSSVSVIGSSMPTSNRLP
jgi:hypothetical protein